MRDSIAMKEEWGQQVSDESRPDDAAGRVDLGSLAVSPSVLTLHVLQTQTFVSTARNDGLD